jgi:hypothetical protein
VEIDEDNIFKKVRVNFEKAYTDLTHEIFKTKI